MDKRLKIAAGTAWFFDYDNDEFEKIRESCLQDKDNWLRENYTVENLKISDHVFYCIIYDHEENPIGMAGGKEYNNDVLRLFNRWYAFPNNRVSLARTALIPQKFMASFNDIFKFIHRNFKYNLYFVSMQQRNKRAKQQIWWKTAVTVATKFSNSRWINYDKGLVQVANCEETSCYQNVMYYTRGNYKFEDWNPKVMSYDEHALRMDYETRLQHRL